MKLYNIIHNSGMCMVETEITVATPRVVVYKYPTVRPFHINKHAKEIRASGSARIRPHIESLRSCADDISQLLD
jgi:hypothetical protein